MMALAPISWLDKCRKYNHLISYISNSNFKFKFSKFQIQNKLLCLPVFVAKRIFKTYQRFCFLCFILVDAFSGSIKTEITKKSFTLAESNFGEKKTFVHSLELWRNFICGNETGNPGRAVSLHLARSGSQSEHRIRCILPARGACHIIITYIYIFVGIFSLEETINLKIWARPMSWHPKYLLPVFVRDSKTSLA